MKLEEKIAEDILMCLVEFISFIAVVIRHLSSSFKHLTNYEEVVEDCKKHKQSVEYAIHFL